MLIPTFAKSQELTSYSELKVDAMTKPTSEYKTFSTRTIDQIPGFKVIITIPVNVYESRTDQKK